MKDKELRQELKEVGILDGGFDCIGDMKWKLGIAKIAKKYTNYIDIPIDLKEAEGRIAELESKLAAVMELLNIEEIPKQEEERKLKKGNKEASLKTITFEPAPTYSSLMSNSLFG